MADPNYGTGKRKDAVARVWLTPGTGNITVNGKALDVYFPRVALQQWVWSPLRALEVADQFDVKVTAKGGGISGQAGAARHGIAKALVILDEERRVKLREI
ncbi:MAG: 30S ribosomal protein S9, partial [Abditibacteriaceae bacterium]